MPTEEQCNLHRERILEKNEECFNKLQLSMEKNNEKIFDKLDELKTGFTELNTNFKNVYKTQINVLSIIDEHEKTHKAQSDKIANLEKERFAIYKVVWSSIVFIGIIWGLVSYIYFGNLVTRSDVEHIISDMNKTEQQ